jgi:hypothetical protein
MTILYTTYVIDIYEYMWVYERGGCVCVFWIVRILNNTAWYVHVHIRTYTYICMYVSYTASFNYDVWISFFVLCKFLANQRVISQPSAISGGRPLEDWQSAVGWGDAGFEPGAAGQQTVKRYHWAPMPPFMNNSIFTGKSPFSRFVFM